MPAMRKRMRRTGPSLPVVAFVVAAALASGCGGDTFELVAGDGGPQQRPDAAADGGDVAAESRDGDSSALDAGRSDGLVPSDSGMTLPRPDRQADAPAGDASRPAPTDARTDAAPDTSRFDAGRDVAVIDAADASAAAETGAPRSDAAGIDAPSDSVNVDGPPPATCDVLTTFYRDRDGDGYGSLDDHVAACQPPAAGDAGAWVTAPGDCRDDLAAVRPDTNDGGLREARYTGQGYADPTKPGGVSFDVNCDGVEDADPTNLFGTEPTCPFLIPGCSGEGYVLTSPERTGPTVNGFCGSRTVKRCVIAGLGCRAEFADAEEPFRCH